MKGLPITLHKYYRQDQQLTEPLDRRSIRPSLVPVRIAAGAFLDFASPNVYPMVIRFYRVFGVAVLALVIATCFGCKVSAGNGRETTLDKAPKDAPKPQAPQSSEHATNVTTLRLFRVKQNGKLGYVDKAGSIIIPAQFDAAADFSEGLAGVAIESAEHSDSSTDQPIVSLKWGFINEAGQVVIPTKFARVGRFSEGLAWVETENKNGFGIDKHGYVNKTGTLVIAPQLSFIFDPHGIDDGRADFKEGLAVVKMGRQFGYIDTTGSIAIKPTFQEASAFSEGVAAVKIADKHGYIDRAGKVVIRARFSWAGRFSEGLAAFEIEGGYGYIDKSGEVTIRGPFSLASRFSEGLAMVHRDGRIGYIDKTGNVVVTTEAKSGGDFREGLAPGWSGGRFGYVDQTGGFAIKPQYDRAESFSGGIARVYVGLDQWGYIDKRGEYVWKPTS